MTQNYTKTKQVDISMINRYIYIYIKQRRRKQKKEYLNDNKQKTTLKKKRRNETGLDFFFLFKIMNYIDLIA